jgi:cellulose synthase/poly-beta-1,6-N-acetylglucosamine synthase-like glycosyltransferase
MHEILAILWIVMQVVIGLNLILPLLLYVIFMFKRKTKKHAETLGAESDFAIIVTAYEQTALLPEVVDSILKINYSNYIVYIVADKCDISNLHFPSDKIIILRPEEALASNTKSHFYAIRHFKRDHERLTIIDSDNLLHPQFLIEINKLFDAGFEAVQGLRAAKNLNTTYACLDAARDIYYHFYDGKILFGAGSSATLAGSGMAFTTKLYRECIEHLEITGAGFDKVLQYQIVNKGLRIAFSESAIAYDEKTTNSNQLVKQRARWINTWFRYFFYGFKLLGKGLRQTNQNQLLFGLILLRPPLFIFLILSVFFMLINLWLAPLVSIIWVSGILFFITGFFIALHKSFADKRIYNSLFNIPVFIFYQLLSLLKIRSANKYSVATQHFYNRIQNK